jgi:hypothetical protein
MTKDEALRLALEALEYPGPSWIEARQPAITAIKAALEAKDEPVAWGSSALSKPEYIAEQKAKTKELRNIMDGVVQTVPNFDQLQQIVNNLERCLTRDSKHEFLRVWIRDWTEHKLSKHTSPQRTWVGLTDEDEIDWEEGGNLKDLVKAIEAKLKEKNT